MIIDLLSALDMLLTIQNLIAIFAGVAFGVFMGAVPGLTGTMGIALIIPLTYAFEPITAFALLLGTYKGALFSGCIPAILINTPGTPAAAATVLDGYPLTQKGRGGEAMGMALWSSVIGDVISTIALIFGAILLAQLATKFGPPEFTMLVLFSLTIVAGVSGKSIIKGLIAASIGFIFGTIGLDPMMATPRFTFGELTMLNGISLMAMLIGLFAVSELFIQAEQLTDSISKVVVPKAQISWAKIREKLPTILRGSVIGIILGSIPGLGATPSAFLSYSEAKRASKTPEKFGKGSLDGVAAAESANNATAGGALIPLMALGVPGDVVTAVLLGAFLIHGLAPGPQLFAEHLDLVYAIFIALLIAALMLPIIGLAAIRLFSRIVMIPRYVLYPIIAILCLLGVFGFNSSPTDLWIMLGFGFLGYAMRKLAFPLAPMMIGFVLEPIGEQSLRQALTISSGDWSIFVSTPISILFLGLTVLSVSFITHRTLKERKETRT
ncbi:tripartite tricarboxylate transporter permease [Cohaesibacter gelatinilyticus]|uniref:Putative tricarboxylic transport membrane protein n=1 Tax=Cohaesibacter gelatinilyticus TaxID=372072 RepID=A0A285PBX6_9HYPH|nr:tripartite tricarboxylate transporter permease [Cohaesibacter gelatinilyticus]SNZ19260.1 putative tricarboxylic transport membrane protein [Cohaesibacter gelatinilyticus]